MKRFIAYIGSLLVLSLFPVLITAVWSDNIVWRKILVTQIIIIALLMLIYKTTEPAKEGDGA